MIPGYQNVVKYTDSWLGQIVAAADFAVKQYTKRWLELRSYTEYYDGSEQPDLVIRQWPVLCGTTQVAAGSNGQLLPGSGGPTTINVVSTTGFDPSGRSGTSPNDLPAVCFQTSPSSFASVTYTGVTATSFTGCSPTEPYNGAGTLSSGQGLSAVWQPAVWVDPNGYGGQAQPGTQPFSGFTGPYGDGTLQVQGANYMVYLDGQDPNNGWNSVSKRGILRRIGGYGQGFSWYWPSQGFGGQGQAGGVQAAVLAWRHARQHQGDLQRRIRDGAGRPPASGQRLRGAADEVRPAGRRGIKPEPGRIQLLDTQGQP